MVFKLLKKIFKVGIVTEPDNASLRVATSDEAICTTRTYAKIGFACKKIIDAKFGGSIAIRQVDAGSCNGCELEIHALNNSFYDIERFGIHFVASPRHADILLVTGPVSRHMESALKTTYNATPDPKLVIAIGDCGACGGEFGCSYANIGAVSNVIPVDGVIQGCPPEPIVLLKGILDIIRSIHDE